MQSCQAIWRSARTKLRRKVDQDSFERYFDDVVAVSLDEEDRVLTLGVENDLLAIWLTNNYEDLIAQILYEITTEPLRVIFESGHRVNGHDESADNDAQTAGAGSVLEQVQQGATQAAKPKVTASDDAAECKYRPDFTFDTFVVGNSNRIAWAAAQAVAEKPGRAYNPLLIYGGVALGKTHLLQAIGNHVVKRRKRAKVEYVTSEEFVNLYVEALQTKKLASFRRRFRSVDVLLIDDIQFFMGKVGSSEEFFHTFNALHNNHKQLVMASDRTPQQLAGLEQRLVSRFDWGLSAEIMTPDIETRVAILKKKQEKHNYRFSDEILFLIARNVKSHIRNLESALTTLIMNVTAFSGEMTVARARELLQDRFEQEHRPAATVENIVSAVCSHFDVTRAELLGNRRHQQIVVPRMVAMYLARELTEKSFPGLGEEFHRNHATIIHAIKKIKTLMEDDDGVRVAVDKLTRQLSP